MMLRAVLVVSIASISMMDLAESQSLGPPSRPMFGSTNDTYRRHLGPAGNPCIAVSGYSKDQVVNHEMIDHWITVKNDCSQLIKVRVCYYQSQACIMVDVPPYGRKDTVLGVYPKLREFRYEYKENF
jgi:hypothetical protein